MYVTRQRAMRKLAKTLPTTVGSKTPDVAALPDNCHLDYLKNGPLACTLEQIWKSIDSNSR
jgi:hypothetical protein